MQAHREQQFPGLPPASAEAAAYGERADALGMASTMEPAGELAYGPDPQQRLQIYVPADVPRPLPVVVFFHGGAWVSGGLSWLRFMAPAVTQLPAIFVAGTYRLAPKWRWPAQYDDVCAGIAAVQSGIEGYGGDPSRLIVAGHSAGGHLGTLAILKGRLAPVRACFPLSCSFDLQYGDVPLDSPEGRVYKYLFDRRDQDAEASPINFVEANRTRFHIVWGENDFARIARTSEKMVDALRAAGSSVSTSRIAGAGHFDTHLQLVDPANAWYQRLREELRHE